MTADPITLNRDMLWTVIAGLAIGSFILRFGFLGLVGDRPLPGWLLRHLRYTAVAILPALVAPLVLWPAATDGTFDPARVSAACVTALVGYLTRNVMLAVTAGVIVLFGMLAWV